MQFKSGVLTFALVAFMGSQSAFAELVTNGGFETGDFTGWTLAGPTTTASNPSNFYGVDAQDAASGSYGAYLGTLAGTTLTLSQTITGLQANQFYKFTFSLAQNETPTAGFPNSFEVTLGGVVLYNQTNITPTGPDTSAPVFYSFADVFTTAANAPASETLNITTENDNGFFSLDNVSLTPTAVPEPATLLLVIPALAFVAMRRRRAA